MVRLRVPAGAMLGCMANVSVRDARAGYQLFRAAGGDTSRPELNAELVDGGYGPISDRMFRHYRSLLAAGYNHYISINRFDVARAASRYEDLSASPRYPFAYVGEGVRLIAAKGDRLWQAAGRLDYVSEAGASIELVDPEYAEGLARVRLAPGDFLTLQFLESGQLRHARVVEVNKSIDPPNLEVQFTELVSLAEFAVGRLVQTRLFAFA